MINEADRVKSPWGTEPKVPGEHVDDRTDRLHKMGARLGINRQCSIGWHFECSDPEGESCACLCHGEEAKAKGAAFDAHWASQPTAKIPTAEQVETFSRYDYAAGWEAAVAYLESRAGDPSPIATALDLLSDAIEKIEGEWGMFRSIENLRADSDPEVLAVDAARAALRNIGSGAGA